MNQNPAIMYVLFMYISMCATCGSALLGLWLAHMADMLFCAEARIAKSTLHTTHTLHDVPSVPHLTLTAHSHKKHAHLQPTTDALCFCLIDIDKNRFVFVVI